jgi:non-specific protein-tyrosine kinase
LTFLEALKILNRYKLLIIITVIIAVAFGYFYSSRQTKIYDASITVLVGQNQGLAENLNFTTALQEVANSMSEMITSRTVAEKVIDDYDLFITSGELLGGLSAQPVQQTQLIIISYSSSDPQLAADVADGVGSAFAELIGRTESSRSGLTAQVWQEATVPSVPVSPQPVRSAVLAGFLGLLGSIGLALMLDRIDTRWRSPQDAEDEMSLPVLGVIPKMSSETLSETKRY